MQSSNLAARMDHAAPDLLIEPSRPALQVITNNAPLLVRKTRTRASFETRTIVIRDHGFKTFRVF
jgi:hypothetical protein